MIKGIGIDIINYKDFVISDKFINLILSPSEIKKLNKINCSKIKKDYIYGRFAVKEALVKALGARKFKFNELSVLNNEFGKPYIYFKKNNLDNYNYYISISHNKNIVVAIVILESK